MLSNTANLNSVPCLGIQEECENIEMKSKDGNSHSCINDLNITSNEIDKIGAPFQNGFVCKGPVSDTSANQVTSTVSKALDNKFEILNGGPKKSSQKRKSVQRMHANLSGTKYAVGME